jgi:hypothetical protein
MISVNKFFRAIIIMFSIFTAGTLMANDLLKDAVQVAQKVKIANGEVVTCDPSLFDSIITIPLSFFCDNLEVVKLESSEEAKVVPSPAMISNNYILVETAAKYPFKLFDRKTGAFITNIGELGSGPNQYRGVYYSQIDEKNDRIYILSILSTQIVVFNLKGEPQPAIPLRYASPKGVFNVNFAEKKVAVVILPFEEEQAMAWEQTFTGKLLKSIPPGHLSIPAEFEYDINTSSNVVDEFDFFVLPRKPKNDTLYHYNTIENKFVPQFTFDFKDGDLSSYYFSQTKDYYIGRIVMPKKEGDDPHKEPDSRFFIIDKATLKGSYFSVVNDYLGDMKIEWPVYDFSRGYYTFNIAPKELRDKLEETLNENTEMPAEMREKMETLKNSITGKDNSYIFYGKLKK